MALLILRTLGSAARWQIEVRHLTAKGALGLAALSLSVRRTGQRCSASIKRLLCCCPNLLRHTYIHCVLIMQQICLLAGWLAGGCHCTSEPLACVGFSDGTSALHYANAHCEHTVEKFSSHRVAQFGPLQQRTNDYYYYYSIIITIEPILFALFLLSPSSPSSSSSGRNICLPTSTSTSSEPLLLLLSPLEPPKPQQRASAKVELAG